MCKGQTVMSNFEHNGGAACATLLWVDNTQTYSNWRGALEQTNGRTSPVLCFAPFHVMDAMTICFGMQACCFANV